MAERLERTFNWARLGGAGLIFILGPLFPNIGQGYLYGLGAFVLIYAATVYGLLHSERALARFDLINRAMFVIDVGIVAFGMLVFAADPSWTTFVVATLMIIGGGFRFGTAGAFAAAGALALAYVAIAAYRAETYGLVVEPPRLAFHVSVMVIAAYMMSGLLRELEHLRAQREKFVRQAAEAAALRQADRIKSEFLAAMSHDFRSPLTDEEQKEMRRHTEIGHRLLKRLPEFWEGAELVLSHHERHDGMGYPRGLKGDELPFEVSVISVADSYDAMTTDRPYRKGLGWDAVRAELLRQRGKQWRERAVDSFIEMIDDERRALPVDRPVVSQGRPLPASQAAGRT